MTWIDRLSLLAAEFDLTFRILADSKQVELVPAPSKVSIARTYSIGGAAATIAKRWSRELPEASVSVEGTKIRLEGTVEDHEVVERRLHGKPNERTTVTAGPEVYELTLKDGVLDQVVQQLGQRLNLTFEWDRAAIEAAGISLNQPVAIKVRDASLDDLLRTVFAGTGLAFRRNDQTVSIFPAVAGKTGGKK